MAAALYEIVNQPVGCVIYSSDLIEAAAKDWRLGVCVPDNGNCFHVAAAELAQACCELDPQDRGLFYNTTGWLKECAIIWNG